MPERMQPDKGRSVNADRPRLGRPPGIDAARERADRNVRGLSRLLSERPDLQGVHAPADWAYDAVPWSA